MLVPPKLRSDLDRLAWIRDEVMELSQGADAVVIEAPFVNPRMAGVVGKLMQLHGVVQVALHERHLTPALVPPAVLKKYATGKGNADKHAVLAAAIRRLEYAGSDDNEADALWLWAMAHDHFGHPVAEVPKVNRAVLTKVDWPIVLGREVQCGGSSGPF